MRTAYAGVTLALEEEIGHFALRHAHISLVIVAIATTAASAVGLIG